MSNVICDMPHVIGLTSSGSRDMPHRLSRHMPHVICLIGFTSDASCDMPLYVIGLTSSGSRDMPMLDVS